MGKRNNKNGSQKKAGNDTSNDAKLAFTQETPVKGTTAGSATTEETPVMETIAEGITTQETPSQETDSNALRSEMRRLEDKLKDTQDALRNTREQSKVEISGLNLGEYGDDVLNYEGGIRVSKIEKEKLQATVKELKSVIQTGCITTEVLKQDFDKERLTHLSEVERLTATILELQRKNMSKDIEVKPEPSNIEKSIPSASTDKANADYLAVLSLSLTQNDVGILTGFYFNTDNGVTSVGDYRVLVRKWQTSYSYLETIEILQATYCQSEYQYKMGCKKHEEITSLRNELSAPKIETINCQEKLIASHGKLIDGMKEEANIKRTEEKIKQDKLKDAHQKAIESLHASYKAQIMKLETDINALNKNCETRIMEVEKEHLPYRDLAESVLAREFEWCKHPRARNEEIIDQGNLAAHGGNCLAVLRRTELSPTDGDDEWFRLWYGISIETFAKHKDSPRIQKLLDMRYEMKKFKTVHLFGTAFERNFQKTMWTIEGMEERQLLTSSQSHVDGDESLESTSDPIFLSICSEYNETAEYEKRRRKSDCYMKLGHNGQNMGDSIVDRTIY
ncbi:uncharacterized protein EAF02_006718 [Botrytis sinoallii]|uniref:uncharacterized protein n=1 Tax=Botrytis sinoallii TaxID=1463999 RepID=UPI001901DDA9|nr:uncharacterized protein EAF02_006718 [Botrytis sinoallii]KAF7880827.1 hypothetical protein EAF02_006718 [Botrytis sinoallii]